MPVRFSKHAREKLEIRKLDVRMIQEVLDDPEWRFYDTLRGSKVAAKSVKMSDRQIVLAVVYVARGDEYHVITVYPSKTFDQEAGRKVKSGRWVISS